MDYKIIHSNSMGTGPAGATSAKGALDKIAELRRLGGTIDLILEVVSGKTVEESQLRQRAAQDAKGS